MSNPLNPGFGTVLIAAGLGGLVVSWTDDGTINFGASVTSDQQVAIMALHDAYDATKTAKIAELRVACAKAIVGGFASSALGSTHNYPSQDLDQQNMAASVLASLLSDGLVSGWTTPFWCQDGSGAWAFVPHTATQIQQVGSDGKLFVMTAQQKLVTLSAEVMAATSDGAVAAIAW